MFSKSTKGHLHLNYRLVKSGMMWPYCNYLLEVRQDSFSRVRKVSLICLRVSWEDTSWDKQDHSSHHFEKNLGHALENSVLMHVCKATVHLLLFLVLGCPNFRSPPGAGSRGLFCSAVPPLHPFLPAFLGTPCIFLPLRAFSSPALCCNLESGACRCVAAGAVSVETPCYWDAGAAFGSI